MTAESSYRELVQILDKLYDTTYVFHPMNKNRHVLMIPSNNDRLKFYVIFVRRWFETFDKIFKSFIEKYLEYSGYGASINKTVLENSIKHEADFILVVLANGYVYRINPIVWLKFSLKYDLIRTQTRSNEYNAHNDTGQSILINEETYSIPRTILEPLGGYT